MLSLAVKPHPSYNLPTALPRQLSDTRRCPVALIAGDDALRSSVALLLTVAGMTVRQHRTIQAFLAAGPVAWGCLVVDYPGLDRSARRLLLELVKREVRLPVVVMTTAAEDLGAVRAMCPNLRVVGKPFDSERFIDTINGLRSSACDAGE